MATATETLNSTTEALKTRAAEAGSTAAEKAKQAAATLGQRAEDATHAVGAGMRSLGETIRDKAPHDGIAGAAASSLSRSLESSGQYLQHEGISGIAEDMTNLVRRNPIPA